MNSLINESSVQLSNANNSQKNNLKQELQINKLAAAQSAALDPKSQPQSSMSP